MLDMGFLPDIRRVLRHIPTKRQTLFFSATMPPPIAQLTREMLHDPVTINLERRSAPATGITQAVYPGAAGTEGRRCSLQLLRARRDAGRARVHAHEAPRRSPREVPRRAQGHRSSGSTATARRRSGRRRSTASRADATGCWWRPTSRRAGSTSPRSATSSTSTCRRCRRTTSTASAARRAPR